MSDDTPTLKLPELPEPRDGAPMSSTLSVAATPRPPRQSRAPLVAFVIVAVLVVAASCVLGYVLISRATPMPAALGTASPSPTMPGVPTVNTPAPLPAGQFTSLISPMMQQCEGHGKGHDRAALQVSWATANATQVWIAEGTPDAVSSDGEQIPTSGDQDSIPEPLTLDCGRRTQTFTITLVGSDGAHLSRSWTVTLGGRH